MKSVYCRIRKSEPILLQLSMPIYEFRCKSCGLEFDLERRMKERDEPAYCSCGSSADRFFIPSNFYVAMGVTKQENIEVRSIEHETRPQEAVKDRGYSVSMNSSSGAMYGCLFEGRGIRLHNSHVRGGSNVFLNVDRAIDSENSTIDFHDTIYQRKKP